MCVTGSTGEIMASSCVTGQAGDAGRSPGRRRGGWRRRPAGVVREAAVRDAAERRHVTRSHLGAHWGESARGLAPNVYECLTMQWNVLANSLADHSVRGVWHSLPGIPIACEVCRRPPGRCSWVTEIAPVRVAALSAPGPRTQPEGAVAALAHGLGGRNGLPHRPLSRNAGRSAPTSAGRPGRRYRQGVRRHGRPGLRFLATRHGPRKVPSGVLARCAANAGVAVAADTGTGSRPASAKWCDCSYGVCRIVRQPVTRRGPAPSARSRSRRWASTE